jgi:hypothetical protein
MIEMVAVVSCRQLPGAGVIVRAKRGDLRSTGDACGTPAKPSICCGFLVAGGAGRATGGTEKGKGLSKARKDGLSGLSGLWGVG